MITRVFTLRERFEMQHEPEPMSGCWLWTGCVSGNGYGYISVNKKQTGAHRFAFEQRYGRIDDGLTVDHLCRVRVCVNPAHMQTVTGRVNTLRGNGLPAINARKTHCIRGHQFGSDVDKHGHRHCRRCKAMSDRASCGCERRGSARSKP